MIFWAVVMVLGLAGVAGALVGNVAFRDLVMTFGVGMAATGVIIVIGFWLVLHWPRLGFAFVAVSGLYVVSWMFKE